MESVLQKISAESKKQHVVNVKSGDTVKVHQKIKEGSKERVQIFQGLVIKTTQKNSHMARITVRRVASGVGVEKSFLINSPLVVKIEVTKRSKVKRNYLSYMRKLTGKSARLSSVDFDRKAVNDLPEEEEKAAEAKEEPKEAPEQVKTEKTEEKTDEAAKAEPEDKKE
jgi:large subunit ribosomal protein L19